MSDVIDTTVVKLGFDNKEFINNVNLSIMAVDALKDSLTFDSKSFDSLSKAANNVDLSAISAGVESLSQRFSTFGIVGMTAIQRITNAAIDLGAKFAGLLAKPWKQILTGGWSRASNIGQAKFQLEGLFGKTEEGVAKLNMTMMATGEQVAELARQAQGYSEEMIVAMNAADYAVADTAYGLDSAAKAASVLATSGVDVLHFSEELKDANGQMRTEMQVALRSISGVAAMANRGYDDVARIFERVSGAGRVMGDDLNSLASFGLNAAATLRDYLNEIGTTANATEKDIRDMVSKGEIDFMTFAKAMDNAYGDHAKDANNTFSGAFSNMKFALSKIGADFITPIRTKMVPLFNDVRIAINQVRKALNFKMKFPGLEEEISLVDLFTRIITNLTKKAHELFIMWHGGQNVMEQAMAGFAQATGESIERVKTIFDRVSDGSRSAKQGIKELTDLARLKGTDLTEVYKSLGKTFEKTEEQIKNMCENGEISFEDFYAAMNNVFGGKIQDTRISQLAQLIHNITQGAWNLARTISSIVGPVLYAFFQVFSLGGINGVIGITEAFNNFTKTLVASRETQEKIRKLAVSIFTILRSGINVVKKLASAVFKIVQAIAPLLVQVLEFADVIASVLAYLVDIVVESNLLSSVIAVLTRAFQVAAYIIVNSLRIVISIVGPAIRAIGEVFAFLARAISSVDVGFIGVIIDSFENLVDSILNGGLVKTLANALITFFGMISNAFRSVTITFDLVSQTLKNAADRVAATFERIITIIRDSKNTIGQIFKTFCDFIVDLAQNPRKVIALIGQVTSLSLLFRFAQTMRGIGRTFEGLGNYLNSNALLAFISSIKTLARAILEFSIAIVLLSSIPTAALGNTIKLMWNLCGVISAFLILYFGYMALITKINAAVHADALTKFMNKLNASINAFLQSLSRAAGFITLGIVLVSLAASLILVQKAVREFAAMDTNEMYVGFTRIAKICLLLAACIGTMALAAGMHTQAGVIHNSIMFGNSGMMGVALTLLALLIVLKEFQNIIVEYNNLGLGGQEQWEKTFIKIGASIAVITGGIAIIGLSSKNAGFSLMTCVSAMMGLMTVLQGFVQIIKDYSSLMNSFGGENGEKKLLKIFTVIGSIIVLITASISTMAYFLSKGSSSLTAGLTKGVEFKTNSAKFIGVVLTLLSLCLVLKTVGSLMQTINLVGIGASMSALSVVATILVGLFAALMAIRGVPTGTVVGIGFILVVLASTLPILTMFDSKELLTAALSLSAVIVAFGFMLRMMSSMEVTLLKGLLVTALMITVLAQLNWVFGEMSELDAPRVLSIALSIASCVAAFGVMFKLINGFEFNVSAIGEMMIILSMLTTFMPILAWISMIEFEPTKLLTLIASISMLAIVLAGAVKILDGAVIDKAGSLFVALTGMAVAISIMAFALVGATNILTGEVDNLVTLALAIDCLIPIVAAIMGLSIALQKANLTPRSILLMGLVALVVGELVALFGLVAMIGDVSNTITLIKGLADAVVGISAFIGVLVTLTAVMGLVGMAGGGIGAIGIVIGLAGMASIVAALAGFLFLVAKIAQIGDVHNTTALLDNMGTSLDALVPFLLKMGAMCLVIGAVSPLVIAGSIGFGSILAVMSGFAFMMALIGNMGNPTNTISIIGTLTTAFNELTKTFAALAALGLIAPLILASLMVITSAMGLLLTLSFIIGQIDIIRNSIVSGIETILLTANSLVAATVAMSQVDLASILKFIAAIGIIALTPMVGVMKFASIAGVISIIGVSSAMVLKGSKTALEMIQTLEVAATSMHNILRVNSNKLVKASTDILRAAYNMSAMIGQYHIAGMIKGLTDPEMLAQLYAAASVAAWVVALAMRNTLGIHSPGKEGEYDIDMTFEGMLKSFTNSDNINGLLGEGSNVMGMLGGTMSSLGSEYGYSAGTNLITSLEYALVDGWKSFKDNNVINDYYQYFHNGIVTEHVARTTGMSATPTDTDTTVTNTVVTDVKFRGNFKSYEEYLAWEKEHPDGDVENTLTFDTEMPDFGNLDEFIKGITENFNIGSITEGLGDIDGALGGLDSDASSASKSVDELSKKIDNLMDKYENLWEDAKDKASKDLFKGVDDQGDDFLDSVEEIMDKFKNIYKSAVEEVNGEDLFAEVNEESESFAPDTLLRNLEDQVSQAEELNTIIASLSTRVTDENLRAAIAKMDVDDLPELRALYRMSDSDLDKYEQAYEKKVQAKQNKIQNELSADLSQLTGGYVDVATYVATDASTNRLINNLQAQVDQLNEYNSVVASLMTKIKDVNLREAIATMGVDALPELRALNNMSVNELDKYTGIFKQKINASAASIKNELSAELSSIIGEPIDIEEFYAQYKAGMVQVEDYVKTPASGTRAAGNAAGQEMSSGISEGLATTKLDTTKAYESGKEYTEAIAKGAADTEAISYLETTLDGVAYIMINAFREYYTEDFKLAGKSIIETILGGFEEAANDTRFNEIISSVPDKVIKAIDNRHDSFYVVGQNIVYGIKDGMLSDTATKQITNAAVKVATLAIKTAKKTLDEHSPSRVFMQIGKYLDEGFAIGIKDNAGLAADEAGDMAGGTLSAVQDAIQMLSGMLDGSIDLNPTITPTLDLSEINARSAALSSMFNGRQIAVQARADEQQAEMITKLGDIMAEQNAEPRTMTFNQNNYSPKALSRTEIYRQTRNGFSQLASAIQ
ncbi:MAG: hypothetical protein J6Y02_12430 [Pseudobutyrivibrio sp.]|nr:hypothetical protein [Pseudobutyrivibrio sp.]